MMKTMLYLTILAFIGTNLYWTVTRRDVEEELVLERSNNDADNDINKKMIHGFTSAHIKNVNHIHDLENEIKGYAISLDYMDKTQETLLKKIDELRKGIKLWEDLLDRRISNG